ncbi:MAG: hypothetical protein ACPHVN_06965, partial [Luminiphilus sp.]
MLRPPTPDINDANRSWEQPSWHLKPSGSPRSSSRASSGLVQCAAAWTKVPSQHSAESARELGLALGPAPRPMLAMSVPL